MSTKSNISHYRRQRKSSMSIVDVQKEAHKIAFYPMMFQTIRSMIKFDIITFIIKNNSTGVTKNEIVNHAKMSEYAVGLMLDIGEYGEMLEISDGKYYATKLGKFLVEDEIIKINMNFMHDVCYEGAFYLDKSFQTGKPEGLKVFGDWETIYQGLGQLPAHVQKSWFDFDNYYSDLLFDEAAKIVLKDKPKVVYDIGGNTAKFDIALLKADKEVKSKIFDLPPQLEKAKVSIINAKFENRVEFFPVNILDESSDLPKDADAIWMSQFLDCFSPERIVFILKKLHKSMKTGTKLFILEPFVDMQNDIAALALTNISLYFTCMANGYSRMYKQSEMLKYVEEAGLKLVTAHQNLGEYDYTLLECVKEK